LASTTLHVWETGRTGAAMWRIARDRSRLRRLPGVQFAKLLGTAPLGGTGPKGWAAFIVWDGAEAAAGFEASPVAAAWQAISRAYCRLDLDLIDGHGRWARRAIADGGRAAPHGRDDPTLALTRARLRPTRALRFWRAFPQVVRAAAAAPGLLCMFGIGEAPAGWQGTISIWRSSRHLVSFAYRHPEHLRVIERSPAVRWYAEELFARYRVVGVTGDRRVLGWEGGDPDAAGGVDP
jgi:hypothetical protein